MKTLFTIALAFLDLVVNAQSTYVHLKPDGYYSTDTTSNSRLSPDKKNNSFKIFAPISDQGFVKAKYKNSEVFIDTSQILKTDFYRDFLHEYFVKKNPKNPYNLKFKIDSNKNAYYDGIIKSNLSQLQLVTKVKQFNGHNLTGAMTTEKPSKFLYSSSQTLYIPESVGEMNYTIKYLLEIEVSDGICKYRFSNINFSFVTYLEPHPESKSLFEEYELCNDGTNYNKHLKRLISADNYFRQLVNALNSSLK